MKKQFLLLLIVVYDMSPLMGMKQTSEKLFKNKKFNKKVPFKSYATTPKFTSGNPKSQKKINFSTMEKTTGSNAGLQMKPSLLQRFKNWISFKSSNEVPAYLAYSPDKSFTRLKFQQAENEYRDNSRQHTQSNWAWLWGGLAALGIGTTSAIMSEDYGHGELQGRRRTMEDAYDVRCEGNICLYGLYDGHGGSVISKKVASILNQNILEEKKDNTDYADVLINSYLKTDTELKKIKTTNVFGQSVMVSEDQGTTAITALIDKEKIIVANAGDSRAVLCNNGRAIPLSEDQKPDRPDEKNRIEKLGGKVIHYGVWRVQGNLAISRALGDHGLSPYVIPNPEIKTHKRSSNDQFLIIACDGVWDVFSNEDAVNIVQKALKGGIKAQDAAQMLVQAAYDAGSTDNISALVIDLKKNK